MTTNTNNPKLEIAGAAKVPEETAGAQIEERLGFVRGTTLYETVATPEGLKFAVNNGTTLLQLEEKRKTICPPHGLSVFDDAKCFFLPSDVVNDVSAAQLIEESKAFILQYADVPESWLEPMATYALMTWVYDRFSSLPYLRFLGDFGTGKSRCGEIVSALSFRSLKVGGNITGAGLFRTIDLMRGTLMVDEADFQNTSDEWNDIIKVLNTGYKVGLPLIRCDKDGERYRPHPFVVYGPKILSTRYRLKAAATESRCLTLETKEIKVNPRIPYQLPDEFYSESQKLRNKFLGWRFAHFQDIRADDSKLRDLPSRLGEIGASLLAVSPNPKSIIDFLTQYAVAEKEHSPKEALREVMRETALPTTLSAIALKLNIRLDGSELDNRAVGPMVRSLGYQTTRKSHGTVVFAPGASIPADSQDALQQFQEVREPQP